jgi:hypothetical protein
MNVGDLVELSAVGYYIISYKRLRGLQGIVVQRPSGNGRPEHWGVRWFGYNRTIRMQRRHIKIMKGDK